MDYDSIVKGLLSEIERGVSVNAAGQVAVEGKEYPIFEDLDLPIDDAGENTRR